MRLARCYTHWCVKLVSGLAIITLLLLADQCVASSNIPSRSRRINFLNKRADAPQPTPPPTPLLAAEERFKLCWSRIYVVRYSFTSDRVGDRRAPFDFAAEWYQTNAGEINNALARAIDNWPLRYDPSPGSDFGVHLVRVKKLLTRWLADTENWTPQSIVKALVFQMNAENPDLAFRIDDEGPEDLTFTIEEAYLLTVMLFWPSYIPPEPPTHEGGIVVYERGESSQQPPEPGPQNPCTVENPPGVQDTCVEFCSRLLVLIFASCLKRKTHLPRRNITMIS